MGAWNSKRFGDLVEFPPKVKLTKGDSYLYLGMEQITPGTRHFSSDYKRVWKGGGSKFEDGDILFARITPCLENRKVTQACLPAPGFGSTEFFVFRAKPGQCDPGYLYYLSTTDLLIQNGINSYVGASGRQRADDKFLRRIGLNCPDVQEQQKIAAVLTAYDDLIENNRQRIALLEEMAEEIYREWFVRLRFPGHEHTPVHKGVPEGWEQKPLPDCISIKPQEKNISQEHFPYVGMDRLSTTSAFFSTKESRSSATGPKFRNGDVLLPRITPCLENGKRGFVTGLADGEVATGSTEFIVLRGKTLPPEFVYCLSISDSLRQHAENSMVGASGRQRVQEACLNWMLINHPPKRLLDNFSEIVSPMYELAEQLLSENNTLTETRNLLLNRLISGKLRVDDLDIQFPPSMRDAAA